MKLGSKILMGVVGMVVPTIVSACYGAPAGYGGAPDFIYGRVVDAQTKQGLSDMRVSCLDAGGTTIIQDITGVDGFFTRVRVAKIVGDPPTLAQKTCIATSSALR